MPTWTAPCILLLISAACAAATLPFDRALVLKAVNNVRARHGAPPVAWSDAVGDSIAEWVEGLAADGGGLRHTPGDSRIYGENLAYMTAPQRPIDGTPALLLAVDMWYSEEKLYDYSSPGYTPESGHFTQLVWVETRRIGAAVAVDASGRRVYMGMAYDPPGNMWGAFDANVRPVGSPVAAAAFPPPTRAPPKCPAEPPQPRVQAPPPRPLPRPFLGSPPSPAAPNAQALGAAPGAAPSAASLLLALGAAALLLEVQPRDP